MKRLGLFVWAMVWGATPAVANTYLEMITTPPPGYVAERTSAQVVQSVPLWYDNQMAVSSPVVTSPLPKYLAWQKAKANEDNFNYVRDDMQNVINFLGGAAVARLVYDIWGPYHRHHLFR